MKAFNLIVLPFFILIFLTACEEGATPEPIILPEALTSVTDAAGNTYEVGYKQKSNNNQDSWVEKKNANGDVLWKVVHASATGVDERATLVNVDPDGRPWVVFTVDGGSYSDDYITKKEVMNNAFDSVFLSSYGRGGGAKVAVICLLDSATGKIEKGTFMMARTKEGNIQVNDKTNTLVITKIGAGRDKVMLEAKSWYLPPAAGSTEGNFIQHPNATAETKSGSHWKLSFEFPTDLSALRKSEIILPSSSGEE